jgi:hypothetical protein
MPNDAYTVDDAQIEIAVYRPRTKGFKVVDGAVVLFDDKKVAAQAALDKSDMVAVRCVKAGVEFPSEWQAYVASLRAVMSASDGAENGVIPTMPSYPAGT